MDHLSNPDAHAKGWRAGLRDAAREANPFPPNTPSWFDWDDGWLLARRQKDDLQ